MILGTTAILDAIADGRIVCDPAPARAEGAHIDVTLGRHYWRRRGAPWALWRNFVRPRWDRSSIVLRRDDPREWFSGPHEAERDLWIPPGGFVLAHTEEFVGVSSGSGLLPTLHTRSTLARWGLGLHPSAGWGDPAWAGRWTLEIINPHPVAVAIPVGARVGCVALERIEGRAADYEPGTRYNATRETWRPESMLPRRGNW